MNFSDNLKVAKSIGSKIGIDWSKAKFSVRDLANGMDVEQEHNSDPKTDVVNGDEDLAKIALAHLEEAPDYYNKLKKLESSILEHIKDKTIKPEHFNALIFESMPESVRNRVRRRVNAIGKISKSHTDNKTGHSDISLPSVNKRVMPKREPINQQSHGTAKAAQKRSTRTQNRSRD